MPELVTTRRRSFSFLKGKGDYWGIGRFGNEFGRTSGGWSYTGTQITESEGHPFSTRKGNKADLGGPFYTEKRYVEGKPTTVSMQAILPADPTARIFYRGAAMPAIPLAFGGVLPFPDSIRSSDTALDALGATAIAKCAPGNPPASLSTFLGELLHDGLPSLVGSAVWKSRGSAAKAAGDEYLNTAFGWSPLVSDISSLANSIIHSDRVLDQYERDAGKVVRRTYRFPTKKTIREDTISSSASVRVAVDGAGMNSGSLGALHRVRETTQSQWFSGAFTYYLPTGYDSRNAIARLAARSSALLGASLTPDTLWELAPWSWAVDWFSNTGDVIHNVTRFADQGLVMRYGYMMEHSIVRDTYIHVGPSGYIGIGGVAPITLVTETKVRRQANPFGFGLSWEALSPFQQSIVAALGLTHGGR